MKDVFSEISIEPTKENKKDLDRKIHSILGVEYKNCSSTWKLVKSSLAEDREGFIQQLRTELAKPI
jgi:predicted site-specific integrase-resolvase